MQAAGSPPRSQHSPAVVAPSSSTPTASSLSLPQMVSFTVTIPTEAFDSDSNTQTETEPDDDYWRGNLLPVPRGPALRIVRRFDGTFRCPVCPSLADWWTRPNEVRDHVVGKGQVPRPKGKQQEEVQPASSPTSEGGLDAVSTVTMCTINLCLIRKSIRILTPLLCMRSN